MAGAGSPKFTPATAPRQGGKAGRIHRTTLLRKNIELAAAAKGVNPKEFMLGVAGDETLPLELRLLAARDVAKYTHRALAPEAPQQAAPTAALVTVYIPGNNRDAPLPVAVEAIADDGDAT